MRARCLLLISCLCIGLTACGLIQRHDSSGYGYFGRSYADDLEDLRRDRRTHQRQKAASEMGVYDSEALNDNQRAAIETRMELSRMERNIVGRREREQYYKHKPLMDSDRERIAFLQIPTYEARDRWLAAKNLSAGNYRQHAEVSNLVQQNDIAVGMTKPAVRDSWGDPERVEVAGSSIYGNERWTYKEYVISEEGFQPENRVIYFEAGRVVGWEKF